MSRFLVSTLTVAVVVAASSAALADCGKCSKHKAHKHDIVDTAVEAGNFKTLAAALTAADLVETLKGEGPFTVFAPTDEAFGNLPEGTLEGLLEPEHKEKLVSILTYHVVPGNVTAADVVKLSKAKTVQGSEVRIQAKGGKVKVDGANVVKTDIACTNGVIHVIDTVILPEPMGPDQAMRTLEDAIQRGVPVFNHGDHEACADIYTAACRKIIDAGSSQMPHGVMSKLQKTLDRAKHTDHAGARAWALRHGMNAALADLRQMSFPQMSVDRR